MMPTKETVQQAPIAVDAHSNASLVYNNVEATLDAYTNGGKTTAARRVFKKKFLLSEEGTPIGRTDKESYGVWKEALAVTEDFGTPELGDRLRKAAGFCGVEKLDDTDADSDSELNAFVKGVQNDAEVVHTEKLARATDIKSQISVYRCSIVRFRRAFHPDHEKVLAARAELARLCVRAHKQGDGTDRYLAEARNHIAILGPAANDTELPKVLRPATRAQETDWQTLIDGLTGRDSNAYQEAAKARFLDLQSGASETRANARVWLTRFKELVEANNAIQGDPKVLTDTDKASEDAIKAQRLAEAMAQYRAIIGHGKAKRRIRERLERSLAGGSTDKLLMLKGPSGNGKSELTKYIAKALGLEEGRLYTMNLGNVKDAKPLVGWSSTYVSGAPSPITRHLLAHKTGEVMFALEEVDKASEDVQQVVATLLGKNDRFVDAYFDLPPDSSRAHFVLTYNEEERLIPHLRDRVKEAIATTPLNAYLKERVLREVLIPRKNQEFGLKELIYDDDAVRFIMQRSSMDEGARQLEADVARVASNVDWRRRHGETIPVVEAHHVARAVDGVWTKMKEPFPGSQYYAAFWADVGFLDAQEKLSGEGLLTSFETSRRKWQLRLHCDSARLTLLEGEPVIGDFALTLTLPKAAGEVPPRFVVKSAERGNIGIGEGATWSWRTDDRALQGLLDAAKASEQDENAVLQFQLEVLVGSASWENAVLK